MKIGTYTIGGKNPVFVIAEAGVNHNNNLEKAFKMIDIAAKSGANAIKFQTWNTELLQLKTSEKPSYQKKIKDKTYYEIIKNLEPTRREQKKISQRCRKKGILFLSTPYDSESVDFLDALDVPAYKISSSDLTNHILLRHVARKNKPVILSTGLADIKEVKQTVNLFKKMKKINNLILMQTTSNYPTPPEDVNLMVIPNYAKTFKVPIGFSDHTNDAVASLGAITLGATIVEKHFTLSRKLAGPDQSSSLEPIELEKWIKNIRNLEKCFGSSIKFITNSDKKNLTMRKIIVIKPISKGTIIKKEHLTSMRGRKSGIIPLENNLKKIIGKKIRRNIPSNTQFSWKMI